MTGLRSAANVGLPNGTNIGCTPVIIVGAARSGTNMLRDLLTRLPGLATWPCDEINYIWRHYNAHLPHDELTPAHATPRVQRYVRHAFRAIARRYESRFVVEKTCANALRIGFVDAILPEARFIFLVRDGRDVVMSAVARWKAKVEPGYLIQKARYVPVSDLPYYALRYAGHRFRRHLSPHRALPTWGPRFCGIDSVSHELALEEVCALQWKHSVEKAASSLARLSDKRICQVYYEQFSAQPTMELQRICDWIGVHTDKRLLAELTSRVNTTSVTRWKVEMNATTLARIEYLCGATLEDFGYKLSENCQRAA